MACGRSSIAASPRQSRAAQRSRRSCVASEASFDARMLRRARGVEMPQFRWSAIDGGGNVIGGLMEASDTAAVVERLQRQGQLVLRADPADRRYALSEV